MSSVSPRYYRELVLSALLHDVGKLLQRADRCQGVNKGDHVSYSVDFLSSIRNAVERAGLNPDVVEQFIMTHHKGGKLAPFDRAAACERKPGDDVSGESLIKGFDDVSEVPFMWVIDGDIKYVVPQPLSVVTNGGKIVPSDNKPSGDDVCRAYQSSRDLLMRLAERLNRRNLNYNQLMDTLVHILRATTLFTPAAAYGVKLADTSLYAHLLITAALASTEVTNKRFRLLGIDVHGIQRYITRVQRTRFASKALRGRSLYISLLQKMLVNLLIEKLNSELMKRYGEEAGVLTYANVIVDTGGEVTMLIPAIDENTLESIARQLEGLVVKETQGQLRISIAWTDEKPVDCSVFSGDGFRELMRELSNRLLERRFRNYVDFTVQPGSFTKCEMCGSPTPNPSEYRERAPDGTEYSLTVCSLCHRQLNLGKLAGNLVAVIELSKCPGGYQCIEILNKPLVILPSLRIDQVRAMASLGANVQRVYLVNNVTDFIFDIDNVAYGYVFTNSHIPYDESGVLTLDRLGRYLFTVRLDGNNMGMHKYNAQETPSKYVTFSNILSLIFEVYANVLAREYSEDVYVVYSGGDDAALVGNHKALDYVSKIVRHAEDWGFRVSVGASLNDAEVPVLFSWINAGKAEEEAKEISRDVSIAVITRINDKPLAIKVTELDNEVKYAEDLVSKLAGKEVGTSMIYRLLNIITNMYYHAWLLREGDANARRLITRDLVNYSYIVNRNKALFEESVERYMRELSVENMVKLIQPLLARDKAQSAVIDALTNLARIYTRVYIAQVIIKNEKQPSSST
ncbi:type III-A CRISPR-associated protein Cas10/Csm1 [Vulcanisaeta thermophila]|uniref:type III-A CRISPR-associated protein Cas10/Csm1 n=1 Tax=Vulcanisaeta thermophila TaxID=867917 RepID=UPI000852DF87|nr:type III-A CRISPR-associated protein Cas10/Csm1 [Vulcanisaeta thermophila]